MTTFYPGVGADAAIADLHRAIGEITSTWADVEDTLFTFFVVGLTGEWLIDLRPYRSAFFALSSFEMKMRMINAAMKTRYSEDESILAAWRNLKRRADVAANDRNQIAHLIPVAFYTADKDAPANVRLVPPFWKSSHQNKGARQFEEIGFSLEDVRARKKGWDSLSYDLQQLSMKLMPPTRPKPEAQTDHPS